MSIRPLAGAEDLRHIPLGTSTTPRIRCGERPGQAMVINPTAHISMDLLLHSSPTFLSASIHRYFISSTCRPLPP